MEEENKKEMSNKKAITLIIITIILLIILGIIVKATFFKEDNCANEIVKPMNIQEDNCVNPVERIIDNIPIDPRAADMKKPVIYLYPTQKTKINVKLEREENLTCTYPKYKTEGWNVIANPEGELKDIKTGRKLYCLYWEGKNTVKPDYTQGFIVKGEDTSKFLEEKLAILGLNEREAEEFIIYWLPRLEANKYNFIRFQTTEEINENMLLEITPKPDTTIRIVMEFKGLEKPIEVEEQKLETPNRTGFVAVEWGGTQIK